jgi:hypothetical protein
VDVLLEAAIDVNLLLAKAFNEGCRKRENNPALKFSETEQDSLGNPKQIRIRKESEVLWNPVVGAICTELASFYVLLKKGDPQALDFFDRIQGLKGMPLQTSGVKSKGQSKEVKASLGIDLAKRKAGFFYHQRQRKRSHSKYSRKNEKKLNDKSPST